MAKIKAFFTGSGAARYFGLGFRPDFVRIRNTSAADFGLIEWDRLMRLTTQNPEGLKTRYTADGASGGNALVTTVLADGAGVVPYKGGDLVTASAATHLVLASSVPEFAGDMRGKLAGQLVTRWTPGAGNGGHFDAPVDTDYVGVGSRVLIGGEEYTIVAIANDGDAGSDVTLNDAAAAGDVGRIGYKADFVNAPAGTVMPAGIYLAETADVNASPELCILEAGTND